MHRTPSATTRVPLFVMRHTGREWTSGFGPSANGAAPWRSPGEARAKIKSGESIDLEKFRKLVRSYIERHHYKAAVFWADKVVSLSNGSPADVYWLAQSYYLTKQYHRAILLINGHKLTRNATCRYLVALCYYEVGEYHSALDILERSENNNVSRIKTEGEAIAVPEIDDTMSIDCSTHLLKGYIYEASDNRALAVESFRAAVQADPLCYEAIHALTQHHMLTVKEEKDLLSSLPLSRTCSEAESAVVLAVYETRTNKYSSPSTPLPQPAAPLATNADFITAQAEKLYYNCNFAQCHRLTQEVLKKDPYHTECLPIHVSCLVELKQSNSLNRDDNIPQLDPPSDIVGTDTNASDITSDITPASADDPLSDSNLLGTSIGQPVMHSSDVGRDSLSQSLAIFQAPVLDIHGPLFQPLGKSPISSMVTLIPVRRYQPLREPLK
ncbi:putative cell division cycle protein 16-like [Penaeus vannamei]|uniref:Putative cell division cycle protein 16-like n=1 Tax=Penaeus vannamei TaxID=6689 RepID=A0A3R7NZH6_PENVA|nr:putative cell division cycle protein 16-like [Penaeus vannamei]